MNPIEDLKNFCKALMTLSNIEKKERIFNKLMTALEVLTVGLVILGFNAVYILTTPQQLVIENLGMKMLTLWVGFPCFVLGLLMLNRWREARK